MRNLKKLIIKIVQKIFPTLFNYRVKKVVERTYYLQYKKYKNVKKILYALTPPPHLSNIGDQAQVVAIYKWIKKNYPNVPIIEANKDDCISFIKQLKKIIKSDDLILIHSGGNLGDRGIWSETGRRNLISNFPKNKIVSLPQTIFFSNTEKGKIEKKKTEEIYNKHKSLTVLGRDFESAERAAEMFPNLKTFAVPDFVLSIDKNDFINTRKAIKKVLFCLRNDNESIFTEEEKLKFSEYLHLSSHDFEYFDTTIEQNIENTEREKHLRDTLNYFSEFEMIITDRFHGVVFATLLNLPIIVLPTIDHKLTSAIQWFNDMPQIKLLEKHEIPSIKTIYNSLLQSTPIEKDWDKLYFKDLKNKI